MSFVHLCGVFSCAPGAVRGNDPMPAVEVHYEFYDDDDKHVSLSWKVCAEHIVDSIAHDANFHPDWGHRYERLVQPVVGSEDAIAVECFMHNAMRLLLASGSLRR